MSMPVVLWRFGPDGQGHAFNYYTWMDGAYPSGLALCGREFPGCEDPKYWPSKGDGPSCPECAEKAAIKALEESVGGS